MKKSIKWTAVLFFFSALLLTSGAGAAESGDAAAPVRAIVLYEENADPEQLEKVLAEREDVSLLWRYDRLFSGAAVEAGPEGLAAVAALEGVAGVGPVRSYAPAGFPAVEEEVWSDGGLALMGADALLDEGLTGDGIVIAVLDSGLNIYHEAFADASLTRSPAISREDVEAFTAKRSTAGRYVSARIPFVCDYYNRDGDVSTTNGHGTHVAALAAGYVRDGDGTVRFRGAAPGAQILGMKIFPDDSSGGADDAVILRALEDAWNLGADVINLSIGTGAGFSRDEVLDGAYSRAYTMLSMAGVVVCSAAGNEETPAAGKTWGQPLPTGAYTDYSAVTAPASYRGVVAVAAAEEGDGGAVIADYSAWGPASGLHLAPSLTAFGGPSVSAGASGKDAYYSDSGTSMACGSASGVFAVALQALRQRGVADRQEAARLAQDLLEGTARLLTDGQGLPLSPRRQGTGLVRLVDALASELVIAAPLVELGDSGEGRFALTLTLKNLSDSTLTVSLDTQVFTDRYEKHGDTYYSLMAPMDISGGVTVSGPESVTIPAGGDAEAELELAVSGGLRQELAEVFPNGFYVEGYVTASGGGQTAHAAFLGYCGDWEAAPVMESLDFRDVQDAVFRPAGECHEPADENPLQNPDVYLSALNAELGAQLAYLPAKGSGDVWYGLLLGSNAHAPALHDDARLAIPGQNTDAMHGMDRRLGLALYTLRSAAGAAVVVSDPDTGEIYYADAETWLGKSAMNPFIGRIDASAFFFWDGTSAGGAALPGGTRAQVDVLAWLDGSGLQEDFARLVRRQDLASYHWLLEEKYDAYRALQFSVTIDSAAPVIASAEMDEAGMLSITLQDDQYLAYATVQSEDGTVLAESAFFPEKAGESCELAVKLSSLQTMPEILYVTAEDYASNTVEYALDWRGLSGGEAGAVRRTARHLLWDANPSSWYWDAVDYAVSAGLMECDRDRRFEPTRSAARNEIVSALYRAGGSPAPGLSAAELPFIDLSYSAGCLDSLCWAYEQNLISGRSDGIFDGSAGVTRQELAVMLYRCAKLSGEASSSGNLSAFPDGETVSDWAMEAMAWAVGEGLLRGGSDGKLAPRANVTRAETAQILQRFLEK